MGNNQSTEAEASPQPPSRKAQPSSSSSSTSSTSSSLSSTSSRKSFFDRDRSNSTKGSATNGGAAVGKAVIEEERDPNEPIERLLRRLLYDTTPHEEDSLASLSIGPPQQQPQKRQPQLRKKEDSRELLERSIEEKPFPCPPDGAFAPFPLSRPNFSYVRPGEEEAEV